MTVTGSRNGTDYFGTFPILFQHVSGFEQDIKCKAKLVLSYDRSAPVRQ